MNGAQDAAIDAALQHQARELEQPLTFEFGFTLHELVMVVDELHQQKVENVRHARSRLGRMSGARMSVPPSAAAIALAAVALGALGSIWAIRAQYFDLWREVRSGQSVETVVILVYLGPPLIALLAITGLWLKLSGGLERMRLRHAYAALKHPSAGSWLGKQRVTLTSGGIEHGTGVHSQSLLWSDIARVDAAAAGVVLIDFAGILHVIPETAIGHESRVQAVRQFAQRCIDASGGGESGRMVRHLAAHHVPCVVCNHDLHGNPSAICPECGVDFTRLPSAGRTK